MDFEIKETEKLRFESFFNTAMPVDGYLSGQQAREIFLKSGLPTETLGKIWQLADKNAVGKLNLDEFTLAMYLITKLVQGTLTTVPTTIPPKLWQSITGNGAGNLSRRTSVDSSVSRPGISRKMTVSGAFHNSTPAYGVPSTAMSTATFSAVGTPANTNVYQHGMTEQDRLQYFQIFQSLDSQRLGKLTGAECHGFFLKSGLQSTDLAVIWELTSKDGGMDLDGFYSAMCLIKKRMAGLPLPQSQPIANLLDLAAPIVGSPKITDEILSANPVMLPQVTGGVPKATSVAPPPISFQTSGLLQINPTSEIKPISNNNFGRETTLESKELSIKENALASKKLEVQSIEDQLNQLRPTVSENQKRIAEIDEEFKKISEKRNNLAIELSRLRTQYEQEYEHYKQTQESLIAEQQLFQVTETELQRLKDGLVLLKDEKLKLETQQKDGNKRIQSITKEVAELTEQTVTIKDEILVVETELKKQQQHLLVNAKILSTSQQDYEFVKKEFDAKKADLEHDRKRVLQLEREASVQEAITIKEKLKIEAMEAERKQLDAKSKSLEFNIVENESIIASIESSKLNIAPTKVRDTKIESDLSTQSNSITKNTTGSVINEAEEIKTKKEDISKNVSQGTSEIVESSNTAGSAEKSNEVEKIISKKEEISKKLSQDSFALDELLSQNKPKSIKSPQSVNAVPISSPGMISASISPSSNFTSAFEPQLKSKSEVERKVSESTMKSAKVVETNVSESSNKAKVDNDFKFDDTFTGQTAFTTMKESSFGEFGGTNISFPVQTQAPVNLDDIFGTSNFDANVNNNVKSPPTFDNSAFGAVDFAKAFEIPEDAKVKVTPFPPRVEFPSNTNPSQPQNSETKLSPASSLEQEKQQKIQEIVGMGFSKEQASNALEKNGNDINRAINSLLE